MTKSYLTNPNHRCIYCKGREVIEIDGFEINTNLELCNKELKLFRCKNQEECMRNISEENTTINFNADGSTYLSFPDGSYLQIHEKKD